MKFTVEIELGNDAMQTGDDVAEALRGIAFQVDGLDCLGDGFGRFPVRDDNGNTVGSAGVVGT